MFQEGDIVILDICFEATYSNVETNPHSPCMSIPHVKKIKPLNFSQNFITDV